MAAYYQDHQGQIYADVAYRLGIIVKQNSEVVYMVRETKSTKTN